MQQNNNDTQASPFRCKCALCWLLGFWGACFPSRYCTIAKIIFATIVHFHLLDIFSAIFCGNKIGRVRLLRKLLCRNSATGKWASKLHNANSTHFRIFTNVYCTQYYKHWLSSILHSYCHKTLVHSPKKREKMRETAWVWLECSHCVLIVFCVYFLNWGTSNSNRKIFTQKHWKTNNPPRRYYFPEFISGLCNSFAWQNLSSFLIVFVCDTHNSQRVLVEVLTLLRSIFD